MNDELRGLVAELVSLTAPADPDDGLSDDEWRELFRAEEMVKDATEAAARRRLKKRLPAARRHLAAATEALEAARKPAKTVEASIAKTEADLAEAQRRMAECETPDEDGELEARLVQRAVKTALDEEIKSLRLKLDRVKALAAPHLAARSDAAAARETARRELAAVEAAIASPFSTVRGRECPEFERYVRYAGAWEEFPDSPAVRRVLIGALRFCGVYDRFVHDIVDLWLSGDPATRQASGILRDDDELRVERTPSGQVVAFDVRGTSRARLSGENREPEPAMHMGEARQALFGDALAGPR